jgi:hypothetical protein
MSKSLQSRTHHASPFRGAKIWLCLSALLLFVIVHGDCHDCLPLRTPWGLAFILIIAGVSLWLRYAGSILSVLLSAVTFCLAVFNVIKEWEYAIGDYGSGGWIGVGLRMSWGVLLVILLAAGIFFFGASQVWRKVFGEGVR